MDCSLCIHHHHVKFSPWSFHFFVTCISKKYLVQTCIQSCVLLEFPSNLDFSVGKMNLFFKLEETATWQCGLDDGQSYAQKEKGTGTSRMASRNNSEYGIEYENSVAKIRLCATSLQGGQNCVNSVTREAYISIIRYKQQNKLHGNGKLDHTII